MTGLHQLTQEQVGHLGTLATVSGMLNASYDVEEVLERIIDVVIETLEAQRGLVIIDRGTAVPEIAVARGLEAQVFGDTEFRYSRSVVERVLSTGEVVLTNDAALDPRLAKSRSIRMLGTRSLLCVPIHAPDRILGAIYVDSLVTTRAFTPADRDLLQVIGEMSAAAIERAQYLSQLIQTEKMATLGTMAAGLAHELNNPLTSIIGMAQLWRKHARDDFSRDVADRVYRESKRCGNLVQDLLCLARREKSHAAPVSLTELVETLERIVRGEFEKEDVELRTDVMPGLPPVRGNPTQLLQVLINLLTNARLAVSGKQDAMVCLRAVPGARSVRILVSDNGPGIAPEHLRQIFEPFFTTREPGEGTGLGLSIAARIVSEHAGLISASNDPSGGAVFKVELPVAAV